MSCRALVPGEGSTKDNRERKNIINAWIVDGKSQLVKRRERERKK